MNMSSSALVCLYSCTPDHAWNQADRQTQAMHTNLQVDRLANTATNNDAKWKVVGGAAHQVASGGNGVTELLVTLTLAITPADNDASY